ncbi:TPA: hypothetical protein OBS60_004713 [Escherichia coli]|uniref:hypothetical protein n=1 Tax=Escherichia coli TaxID=562 RepID=UPI001593A229|nr:hypothetical protein [Escherichia coli]HCO5990860.1 hypothetical protein [Escherichia coli]HCO6904738.1 hypothetical protein [Escherichia coli]HCO6910107.1 hypothetical protein [Escherichia coli]HCO6924810.1 hypothetical protein [Escherichia coli]HCO6944226.1 hypothetical protein [Escherichia coli]
MFSKSATELRPKLPALLEDAAMLYLRIGTCRLNNMAPEKWVTGSFKPSGLFPPALQK